MIDLSLNGTILLLCAADPVQWTLRGLITSQLGNVKYPLVQLPAGGALTPKNFILQTVSPPCMLVCPASPLRA